jgi:FixJ family two-component response regulator
MKSVGNSVNQDGRPTVFVVDDDASVREAVRSLLRSVGLRVETFGTAQEFLSSPCNSSPGCLVLDVRLPEIGGLELQHQLAQRNLHIPIIFITGHGDIPMSVRAIKAGALEFLTKPFRDQDLLDVVQQAIDQDRRARQQRAEIAELRQRYEGLSPREREVMALVARGLPNKQIAGTLGTSEATVKLHRGRSMQKMQAASLADLIRMAEKLAIPASR